MPTNPQFDTPERKALEAAIVESPDDLTALAAYADYLTEQGDPHGAFIQAQLALEDPSRSLPERGRLAQAEAKLRAKHAAEWLGDAGRFLVGPWSGSDKPYHVRFARGWPDFVRTLPQPEGLIAALARSPESRLLRHLEIVYDMRYHPYEFDTFAEQMNEVLGKDERLAVGGFYMSEPATVLPPLIESPYLTNLRVLKLGFSDDDGEQPTYSTMVGPFGNCTAAQVLDLLKKCPRIEELYLNTDLDGIDELFASPLLGNVRVLQYYFGDAYTAEGEPGDQYPLSALAENPALTRVTTLRFHPGRDAEVVLDEFDALLNSKHLPALAHLQVHMTTFGDDGAERVVRSGVLKRLKTLDIGYGNLTDAGAHTLAASPDLKHLDVLNVSRNALTRMSVNVLRATGVNVVADNMHDEDETDYLYEVDRE